MKVDCSGLNITVIKNTMPDFDNLEIDLSNNNIVQNIVKHDFFSRIMKLNLANSHLFGSRLAYSFSNGTVRCNIHDSWQDMTENNQNISTYIREEEERNSHSTSCCAQC
jgi:hypothetical protein